MGKGCAMEPRPESVSLEQVLRLVERLFPEEQPDAIAGLVDVLSQIFAAAYSTWTDERAASCIGNADPVLVVERSCGHV